MKWRYYPWCNLISLFSWSSSSLTSVQLQSPPTIVVIITNVTNAIIIAINLDMFPSPSNLFLSVPINWFVTTPALVMKTALAPVTRVDWFCCNDPKDELCQLKRRRQRRIDGSVSLSFLLSSFLSPDCISKNLSCAFDFVCLGSLSRILRV